MEDQIWTSYAKRIDSYYDNMVSTLETLVNIDSGADCPEGIKEVAANVGDHLKSIGFQVEYLDYPGIATHVLATRKEQHRMPGTS